MVEGVDARRLGLVVEAGALEGVDVLRLAHRGAAELPLLGLEDRRVLRTGHRAGPRVTAVGDGRVPGVAVGEVDHDRLEVRLDGRGGLRLRDERVLADHRVVERRSAVDDVPAEVLDRRAGGRLRLQCRGLGRGAVTGPVEADVVDLEVADARRARIGRGRGKRQPDGGAHCRDERRGLQST